MQIQTSDLGSGKPEQGGGELRGGLVLMNRFTASIDDPAVPYTMAMTICAHDGVLACESFTITRRERGPVVTTTGSRQPVLDSYLIRVRQEIEGSLLLLKRETGPGFASYQPPWSTELQNFSQAQRKARREPLTTAEVARVYRGMLASPDPALSRRPTDATADKLGYNRGHISRMLTQARREGIPGLGKQRAEKHPS